MLTKTGLLFFTQTAALEAAKKSFVFAKHPKANQKVASLLIQNSRKIARSSGLPVFEVNELHQYGAGFGEKLANAIQSVFDNGFCNVVVIGNDCPQLTGDIISNVAAQLEHNDLVLGPDKAGGVYLIGISKKLFNKERFAGAQWQTLNLLHSLIKAFSETFAHVLPALHDANNCKDLLLLKSILPVYCKLKAFILSIIACILNKFTRICCGYNNITCFSTGLRAPPFATSTSINDASQKIH